MSDHEQPEQRPGPVEAAPTTGHPQVDGALAGLADLDETPLGDHPERLARAHELLHRQLQDDRPA